MGGWVGGWVVYLRKVVRGEIHSSALVPVAIPPRIDLNGEGVSLLKVGGWVGGWLNELFFMG